MSSASSARNTASEYGTGSFILLTWESICQIGCRRSLFGIIFSFRSAKSSQPCRADHLSSADADHNTGAWPCISPVWRGRVR